ncbi:hypothetical protein ACJX0J_041557, partial [Zea mays]
MGMGDQLQFLTRFDEIISKCQGLDNVCFLHDISTQNGRICITMNFYEGSIRDKMARLKGGKLPLSEVLSMTSILCFPLVLLIMAEELSIEREHLIAELQFLQCASREREISQAHLQQAISRSWEQEGEAAVQGQAVVVSGGDGGCEDEHQSRLRRQQLSRSLWMRHMKVIIAVDTVVYHSASCYSWPGRRSSECENKKVQNLLISDGGTRCTREIQPHLLAFAQAFPAGHNSGTIHIYNWDKTLGVPMDRLVRAVDSVSGLLLPVLESTLLVQAKTCSVKE